MTNAGQQDLAVLSCQFSIIMKAEQETFWLKSGVSYRAKLPFVDLAVALYFTSLSLQLATVKAETIALA